MRDIPEVLREYRCEIVPAARSTKAGTTMPGLRTKFGGVPDGIQPGDNEPTTCPECFQQMHFVAQIDSFEFNGKENPNRKEYGDAQFMFGDVGMIYVWFCFNCMAPVAKMESH